ncbi:hypothetical protein RI129_012200 [Pyrocoelia pectoralis]|uniref:EH domain-containing protein n=1 Tax=Pyrocoelia pectoralis TaxID=417401 RepID=A0AAN7V619_9COLE
MEVCWKSSWQILILLSVLIFSTTLQGVQGESQSEGPSESECRPHIEKALKQLETADNIEIPDSKEDIPTVEITTDDSVLSDDNNDYQPITDSSEILLNPIEESNEDKEDDNDDDNEGIDNNMNDNDISNESEETVATTENWDAEYVYMPEQTPESNELTEDNLDQEQNDEPFLPDNNVDTIFEGENEEEINEHEKEEEEEEEQALPAIIETTDDLIDEEGKDLLEEEFEENAQDMGLDSKEEETSNIEDLPSYTDENIIDEVPFLEEPLSNVDDVEDTNEDSPYQQDEAAPLDEVEAASFDEVEAEIEKSGESADEASKTEQEEIVEGIEPTDILLEAIAAKEAMDIETDKESAVVDEPFVQSDDEEEQEIQKEESVVEELIKEDEEPVVELRPRDHVAQLLKLDTESEDFDKVSQKTSEILLKDLKKLYENAIRPLETLYKYRDLSAEPSPAYFNILMYGEEPEILDGTELAADYTFSGLQKFGQGLEERLKGYKFPSKLLEKVNIVEIPGILEVRKQVSRIFPFNDACQWFIDRADIIFLVYDPSKLDVGPETEAILDQLKGREHQSRILLNKADQVKPEELMRVQGALIWNISPLMSSAQPPVMYTTSLWSQPYEQWAPVRLLQAQERAFLRDLRSAIDKRIDNKIASARRFAVRVRNHAKMVDCYLTTYYNHKSVFGNRKQVSDEIINHPQDYHIYEGLSTLTNISRYDLPDPDVYRDFFRLNALYDFQQLSSTCTYFRGCPINRLDVAIAYDLPELVGKHKRLIESAVNEAAATKTPTS